MPLEARSHMVSFRLTGEEHARFRELCFSHGLPSISEMARIAINMMFSNSPQTLDSRLTDLETRVNFLSNEFHKLKSSSEANPCQSTE